MRKSFFVFIFCGLLAPVLWGADLELSGGVINVANDFQVGQENWGRVNFDLKNKSKRARSVKIIFRHSTQPGGVYEYKITIPAKQSLKHYFAVAMEEVSHRAPKKQKGKNKKKRINVFNGYTLSLQEKVGNEYRPVKNAPLIDCTMDYKNFNDIQSFAFLTDEIPQMGNLSQQVMDADFKFRVTMLSYLKWPEHWSEYSVFDAIIVLEPSYNAVSPLARQALKDYVKFGGTLIFANPEGLIKAAAGAFEDLLPFTPLKVRQVNRLPALEKMLGTEPIIAEFGMPFVEGVPKKNTYVAASSQDYPLISWRKYGLGVCGALAYDPFHDSLKEKDGLKQTWLYLMDNSSRPVDISQLKTSDSLEVVNMLNGLKIPGPTIILSYLLIYLSLAIILFVVLLKMKKAPLAWVLNTVLALAMTVIIFNKAYSTKKDSSVKTAAVMNQQPFIEDSPSVKIYSIFSQKNEKVTLEASAIDTRFRTLMKVKAQHSNQSARDIVSNRVKKILISDYNGETTSLKNMKLQGLSTRAFISLTRSHCPSSFIANLNLKSSNLSLDLSAVPEELKSANNIYLLGPEGVLALELTGEKLQPQQSQSPRGTLDSNLRNMLKELKIKRPLLVFTVKSQIKDKLLKGDYSTNVLNIYMSPVRENLSGPVTIPSELISIGNDFSSSFVYSQGKWQAVRLTMSNEQAFTFTANLPSVYRNMALESVLIDFGYFNQSGNILVDLEVDGEVLQKNEQGRYLLSDISKEAYSSGKLAFTLKVREKIALSDPVEKFKANLWKVKKLNFSFKGSLANKNKDAGF